MAVTFDAGSTGGYSNTGTPVIVTYSHTCGTGSNRYLVVGVLILVTDGGVGTDGTTATYNGTSMTKIASRHRDTNDVDKWVLMFGLVNPSSGTHDVVITGDSNVIVIDATSMSFSGVHQSDSLGTPATSQGDAGSNASVVVTSATDEVVVDATETQATSQHAGTVTATGTGQVLRSESTAGHELTHMSTTPGTASTTVSYTINPLTGWWLSAGIPLKSDGDQGLARLLFLH
jgi:hypothetical protein